MRSPIAKVDLGAAQIIHHRFPQKKIKASSGDDNFQIGGFINAHREMNEFFDERGSKYHIFISHFLSNNPRVHSHVRVSWLLQIQNLLKND